MSDFGLFLHYGCFALQFIPDNASLLFRISASFAAKKSLDGVPVASLIQKFEGQMSTAVCPHPAHLPRYEYTQPSDYVHPMSWNVSTGGVQPAADRPEGCRAEQRAGAGPGCEVLISS